MAVHKKLAALLCIFVLSTAHAAEELKLSWRVENGFRAFDYMGSNGTYDFNKAILYYNKYRPNSNAEELTEWVNRIASSPNLGSPYTDSTVGPWIEDELLIKSNHSIPSNSTHQPNPRYRQGFVDLPEQIPVVVEISEPTLNSSTCTWSVGEASSVSQPCSMEFKFLVPKNGELVTVKINDKDNIQEIFVKPDLKIILGLGDSYSSGEGSPDVPTKWKSSVNYSEWRGLKRSQIDAMVDSPAHWLSARCGRSFWSFQHLTALYTSYQNPHSITSYASFACAGAEVIDGLLAPQRIAPGHPNIPRCAIKPSSRRKGAELDFVCDVPKSQLASSVSLLCKNEQKITNLSDQEIRKITSNLSNIKYAPKEVDWINDLVSCHGSMRKIDALWISVGGNDMGFSGVAVWGLAPIHSRKIFIGPILDDIYGQVRLKKSTYVCPRSTSYGGASKSCLRTLTAEQRVSDLPDRYSAMNQAFDVLLDARKSDITLIQYPNPLQNHDGKNCSNMPPGSEASNQWSAIYYALGLPNLSLSKNPWEVNLTDYEADEIFHGAIEPVRAAMNSYATTAGWRTVPTDHVMDGRGWCTGERNQKLVSPKMAANWNSLVDDTRMIRTLNDAFLTQWPGGVGRDDGLWGSLHPNVQGHAGMARELLKSLTPFE